MSNILKLLVLANSAVSGTKIKRILINNIKKASVKTVLTKRTYFNALVKDNVDLIVAECPLKSVELEALLKEKINSELHPSIMLFTDPENEERALEFLTKGADDYILTSNIKRIRHTITNLVKKYQTESDLVKAKNGLEIEQKKTTNISNKFKDIIENMFECFYVASVDGRLKDYNIEFQKVLKMDPDKDYRGFKLENFWQNKEQRKVYVQEVLNKGYVKAYPVKARCLDGKEVILKINARLLKGKNNKPRGIVGTLLDVTEIIKIQQALLFNESLLNAMLNHYPENIYFKDKQSRFIKTSLHMARLFGGDSIESLKNKSDFDIRENEQAQLKYQNEQSIIKSGEPVLNLTEKEYNMENSLRYVNTTKVPLHDHSGSIIGTFGISRDITTQVLAEKALQKSSEELRRKNRLIQRLNNELEKKIIERTRELNDQKIELEESNKLLNKSRKAAISIMQDAEIQKKKAEDALKFLELNAAELKKLSRAIEESPVTVIITDKNGIVEYANPNNHRVTGYSIEEMNGKKTNILKSGYHDQAFYKNLWSTILSGKVWTGELLNKKKNGNYFWEKTSISPINNDKREITHFVAVKEDITEKKKVEYELQYFSKFQSLVTHLSSTFINLKSDSIDAHINKALKEITTFIDADTGYVFLFSENNKRFSLKHFWSSANSLINQDILQNIEVNTSSETLNKLLKGQIVTISDIDNIPEEAAFLKRIFLSQGVKSVIAVPMIFNENVIGYLGLNKIRVKRTWKDDEKNLLKLVGSIFTNSIKRKQSQLELIREKKFTETVLQSMPGIFYAFTEDGKFMRWNENFKKFSGYSSQKIKQVDVFHSVYSEDLQKTIDAVYQVLKEGSASAEVRLVNAQGQAVSHFLTAMSLQSGETTYIVGSAFDISKRLAMEKELKKSKERAEQATEAKSRFLAIMSHEIRTPMNAILGFSNLLLKTELQKKQLDYLTKIETAGQSLLSIINDILDFSKIESGMLEIESVEFELNEVLHNVANLINVKVQEKNLELVFNTSPQVPLRMKGDPLRLAQVLLNLTNNAIKFTDKGEIIVKTELMDEADSKANIKFSVVDSGIGLDKQKISRLFLPFTQAERSTSRHYGGTGLGLTISRHLIKQMGGEISVDSKPGQGSTFSFNILVEKSKKGKNRFVLPYKKLKNKNILVVDDNKSSREVLAGYLSNFSFRAVTINSAEKVERKLTESKYDLIIMDWKMPGLDGVNCSLQIKNNPEFKHVPIILMVSGLEHEITARTIAGAGIDGYLIKPITPSQLFNAVLQIFGYNSQKSTKPKRQKQLKTKIENIRGAHILLAEDNEINQQVACELLESEGFWVTIASDGREAVNKVKSNKDNPFDVVLMDLQMPHINGYDAAKSIRKLYKAEQLPVIAMTADAVVGVKEKCIAAGMNDYITKPIIPDALYKTLVKWTKPAKREINIEKKQENDKTKTTKLKIEFLNTEKGIERLKGNSKAYSDIIIKFKNNHLNIVKLVKNHISKGEFEKAQQLVHSVKGVSGNISAERLHTCCTELDQLLKRKNLENTRAAMQNFETEMNNLLNSISAYEKETKKESPLVKKEILEEASSKENKDKAIAALKDIEKLLKENNIKAKELLELHATKYQLIDISDLVQKLLKELESYNFISAYNYLHNYMQKHGLSN